MEIDLAVSSLNDALDEEYPGEFLDPDALRTVLDRLAELEEVKARASNIAGLYSLWPEGVLWEERDQQFAYKAGQAFAARYVLGTVREG